VEGEAGDGWQYAVEHWGGEEEEADCNVIKMVIDKKAKRQDVVSLAWY
jgi:hypothetical protein